MDLRTPLLNLLQTYHSFFPEEKKHLNQIREFILSTPHCFKRSHLAGHITGSAWIVDPTGKKTLLTHHKKLGKWLQLGGHADGNSDVLGVALREATEESGLTRIEPVSREIFDVDIHPIPARKNEPEHFHYDIRFVCRADDSKPLVRNAESKELAWVPLDLIENYSKEESLLRMRRKWRAFIPAPLPSRPSGSFQ
jgi:8-oxo-dGTP pyrophosphatase MutT (NUDIX family)